MDTILVTAKTQAEFNFLSDLLKKLQVDIKVLTDEETEDLGLIKLLKQADRTEKVSRASVMKKLGKK